MKKVLKWLKWIGIILISLIVIVFIASFFIPKKFAVSVTGEIDAPSIYAYNLLNDFKNQEKWDPWQGQDTTATFTFSDKGTGVDSYVDFTSNMFGSGRTAIIRSEENKEIAMEAKTPEFGTLNWDYFFKENGDKSELQWNTTMEIPWPLNVISFIMKRSMKSGMEDGVQNMSDICNRRWKKNTYDGFKIEEEIIESKNYVMRRSIVSMNQIPQFYARNLGPLFQKIQDAEVEMEGKPSGLVYMHDGATGKLDIAAALPINQEVNIAGADSEILEAGRVVYIDYYGDPQLTEGAHMAIDRYLLDRGLTFKFPVVEEYVTDPSEEADESKWLTKIRYYIAD